MSVVYVDTGRLALSSEQRVKIISTHGLLGANTSTLEALEASPTSWDSYYLSRAVLLMDMSGT